MLIAIFPANVHVAMTGANATGLPASPWYTWSRLPFQIVFVWWVVAATRHAPFTSAGISGRRRPL